MTNYDDPPFSVNRDSPRGQPCGGQSGSYFIILNYRLFLTPFEETDVITRPLAFYPGVGITKGGKIEPLNFGTAGRGPFR